MHDFQKRLEEEVCERSDQIIKQNKFLYEIIESLTYPFFVINVENNLIELANKAAKEFYIVKGEKYENLSEKIIDTHNTHNNICTLRENVIQTKKGLVFEYIFLNKNNTNKNIELHAYPLLDCDGNVEKIIEYFFDITEKKQSQESKLKLQKDLDQSRKIETIGSLTAGIAHEISTPIQFVQDNVYFLSDTIQDLIKQINEHKKIVNECDKPKEIQTLINKISDTEKQIDFDFICQEIDPAISQTKEGIDHIIKIVSLIKEFSHMGSKSKEKEDINLAIESTISISNNEWKYVSDIQTELDDTLPLVECYIGEIKQVVLNLIINASHAVKDIFDKNKEKGLISIKTYIKNNDVIIEIRDTGTGIPEEIQPEIFKPFFTTKEVGKGTGQGLALAYRSIVEKHNGKISFISEVGKGTSFFIELPIKSPN